MQGRKLTIIGLIGVALLLSFGSMAFGYKLCGYDWTYMDNPMGEDYLVNANCRDLGGEEVGAVKAGAEEWNTTGGADFAFTYGGTCDAADYSYNEKNEIMWVNRNTGSVATAYIWHGVRRYRRRIYECDMVFNDLNYTWATDGDTLAMDVQNVATHEFGHFLCLGDLYGAGDTEKTMYGYVDYGETKKRTLHPDDIAGIQAIYGGPPPPPGTLHVHSIDMSLKQRGPWTNGIAKVKVVDDNDGPVPQATVEGHWSGLTSDADVFETGSDGWGECSSDKLKDPAWGECFIFTVDAVSKEGWTYDPAKNVETTDQICIGGGESAGAGPGEGPVLRLSPNYPNPFRHSTVVRYRVPSAGRVTLKVCDLSGKVIRVLADEVKEAGSYTIEWRGEDESGRKAASGIYLYKLTAEGFNSTKKMILLR